MRSFQQRIFSYVHVLSLICFMECSQIQSFIIVESSTRADHKSKTTHSATQEKWTTSFGWETPFHMYSCSIPGGNLFLGKNDIDGWTEQKWLNLYSRGHSLLLIYFAKRSFIGLRCRDPAREMGEGARTRSVLKCTNARRLKSWFDRQKLIPVVQVFEKGYWAFFAIPWWNRIFRFWHNVNTGAGFSRRDQLMSHFIIGCRFFCGLQCHPPPIRMGGRLVSKLRLILREKYIVVECGKNLRQKTGYA